MWKADEYKTSDVRATQARSKLRFRQRVQSKRSKNRFVIAILLRRSDATVKTRADGEDFRNWQSIY